MDLQSDLIIQNGMVVTANDAVQADVAIRGDKIAAIGHGLAARESLDAGGLLVIPGGVDPHVHLQYPQGPNRVVSSDDWLTGTVAAACGGTTTVIDFVEARPGQTWMQAFEARLAEAEPQAVIDFGFHMSCNRADEASLAEVGPVIEAGMPSFKIYMAYDGIRLTDPEMLLALEALAEHGGLAIVHAENHFVITRLVQRQLAAGHVEPRWHLHTRPAAGEAEATERALAMAEIAGAPLHIVHVTGARGDPALSRARPAGHRRSVHPAPAADGGSLRPARLRTGQAQYGPSPAHPGGPCGHVGRPAGWQSRLRRDRPLPFHAGPEARPAPHAGVPPSAGRHNPIRA